jgi:hypothetical protein
VRREANTDSIKGEALEHLSALMQLKDLLALADLLGTTRFLSHEVGLLK